MTAVAEFAVPMPVTMPSTPVFSIEIQIVVMRERETLVEFLSLAPQLKLAGVIARVVADLEHRHDDDLDFDRRGGGTRPRRHSRDSTAANRQGTHRTHHGATFRFGASLVISGCMRRPSPTRGRSPIAAMRGIAASTIARLNGIQPRIHVLQRLPIPFTDALGRIGNRDQRRIVDAHHACVRHLGARRSW